ncbi:MAG TPA: cytochrome c-type biogenesis protein CcmH [Terriglobales bacterium]|nr:cytochrome c-type biogenesis protein CcmH [Terriglobales bacterium]
MHRFAATICALMVAASAFAAGRPLSPAESRHYERLTHALIAPCCWREPIAIHRSEEAIRMLDEVAQLIVSGRSEDEIKAMYVARYGERILADPPGRQGQWLYVVPVGVLGSLTLLAILRLRGLVARTEPQRSPVAAEWIARVREETKGEGSYE